MSRWPAGWDATTRHPPGLDRIHTLLPHVPRRSQSELTQVAGTLLIAVPDAAVPVVADQIAGLAVAGTVVWHVSGRYGTGVLAPVSERAAVPLAIHPAMTFTGSPGDLDRLVGLRWGLTAGPDAEPFARALVTVLGGIAVPIAEPDRVAYHAALSHASNFFALIEGQAADVLRGIGVDDPAALIAPLAFAALADALSEHPGFTGPVSRGDAETVSAHLAALRATDPVIAVTYAAMTARSAQRAGTVGTIDGHAVEALRWAVHESDESD